MKSPASLEQAASFSLSLTRDELLIMHQALNEVTNGIDLFEFETRMGATRKEVAHLLDRLSALLDMPETIQ